MTLTLAATLVLALVAAAALFLTDRYRGRADRAEQALAERTQSAEELREALMSVDRQREQLKALNRASVIANERLGDPALMQLLVDELRQTVGAHQAVLSLTRPDGGHTINAVSLSQKYARWRDYAEPPTGDGIYALVSESKQPLRLTQHELESHPRWRAFGEHASGHPPMRGWLAVPMLAHDGVAIGLVQLSDRFEGDFTAEDETIAVRFAQMAAVALERSRLIDELRDAKEQLSVQLGFTRAVNDSIAEGLYTVDRDGALTSMNPTAERLLGWSFDEVKGSDFGVQLCPQGPEHASGWIPPGRRALNARAPIRVEEARFRRRDGTIFDAAFSSAPLSIDGRIVGAVVAFRDISEHKRAQLVLMERERFFALSAELFCIADTAGRFRQVNSAFTRVLGHPEATLLNTPWTDFVHPEDRLAVRRERALTIEQRHGSPGFCSRFRTASGSYRWLEWTSTLAPDGLIYAVARDVTERREAEAELERAFADLRLRNEELQSFAFVASHDLQEPLRKIQAFGDRLRTKYADMLGEQGRDYIERMESAASRMQVLISDLLNYSRISTRGQPFAPVDLTAIARGVLSDLEATIEATEAQIVVGPLPTLEADAMQMRQLLQNLLSNALKFRDPARASVIHVGAELAGGDPVSGEGRRVRLTVSDNGIGFEERYRERIFVPFQRLHGRSEFAGSGIGLAIVRKIVERHHGSVEAHGTVGEGARFVVELPLKQAREERGSAA